MEIAKYYLGFNTFQILDLKVALKNFVYPLNIQVKPRSEKPEKNLSQGICRTLEIAKYYLGFNTLQILDLQLALKNFVYPLNIQVKPRSEKPEKTYHKVSIVPWK